MIREPKPRPLPHRSEYDTEDAWFLACRAIREREAKRDYWRATLILSAITLGTIILTTGLLCGLVLLARR